MKEPVLPPPADGSAASRILHSSALDIAEAVRGGSIDAVEIMQAFLDRIAAVDPAVQAWAHLDPKWAMSQAEAADNARREGRTLGPLHGLPVAVKDIFDTKDLPTEDGTVLHAGRKPSEDAAAVTRLRAAGGVVLGKTVTTELAMYAPGKTRNPHDPSRTPGGSSSGSAAAVASYMAPVGLGTQTNGSVIRPGAYCGVYGFKPSHGLISRHRILQLSRPLDQIGVFARSVEDAALVAESLIGYDEHDPDTRPGPVPPLLATCLEEPPVTPALAFVRTPIWEQAEESTHEAFEEIVDHLGETIEEVKLPQQFNDGINVHRTLLEADLARSFEQEYARGKDRLSPVMREMIERGKTVLAVDYNEALSRIGPLTTLLNAIFHKYDAILTPASTGEAPEGLDSTGSPVFCTLWTLCGVPAITLPLMTGPSGMPLGVQLVGAKGDDARLLRTARWLARSVLEGS